MGTLPCAMGTLVAIPQGAGGTLAGALPGAEIL